jgi:hypothetical protein
VDLEGLTGCERDVVRLVGYAEIEARLYVVEGTVKGSAPSKIAYQRIPSRNHSRRDIREGVAGACQRGASAARAQEPRPVGAPGIRGGAARRRLQVPRGRKPLGIAGLERGCSCEERGGGPPGESQQSNERAVRLVRPGDKPVTRPGVISTVRPSTAVFSPNRLVRPVSVIMMRT